MSSSSSKKQNLVKITLTEGLIREAFFGTQPFDLTDLILSKEFMETCVLMHKAVSLYEKEHNIDLKFCFKIKQEVEYDYYSNDPYIKSEVTMTFMRFKSPGEIEYAEAKSKHAKAIKEKEAIQKELGKKEGRTNKIKKSCRELNIPLKNYQDEIDELAKQIQVLTKKVATAQGKVKNLKETLHAKKPQAAQQVYAKIALKEIFGPTFREDKHSVFWV